MPGAPVFEIVSGVQLARRSMGGNMVRNTEVIPIGSENWRPLGVTGPPKDENYT